MGIDLETSGFDELSRDLRNTEAVMDELKKVVSKGSLNIKKDWAGYFDNSVHLPHLARAVNYDLDRDGFEVTSEIGIDKGKVQGPLGNLPEFGSVNNPPDPAGQRALDAEEPYFINACMDVATKALER